MNKTVGTTEIKEPSFQIRTEESVAIEERFKQLEVKIAKLQSKIAYQEGYFKGLSITIRHLQKIYDKI